MSRYKGILLNETLFLFIYLFKCFCLLTGRNDRPDRGQYGPVGGLCGEGRCRHQEGRQVPAGGAQGENSICQQPGPNPYRQRTAEEL